MRTFILGGLTTSIVWVFLSLDGNSKLHHAWDNFHASRLTAISQELAKEREQAFAQHFQPTKQCLTPTGELGKLECQNRQAMARESFYAAWNRANAKRIPQ